MKDHLSATDKMSMIKFIRNSDSKTIHQKYKDMKGSDCECESFLAQQLKRNAHAYNKAKRP
ncbi:hypothetical protein GCM10009566_75410 [Streptomyces murinus]|uniref:Uncharacterized protein n=2 Tax=Streptomyces TaxID=1883 RepID=A0ABN1TC47_9ACTN